MWLQEHMQQGKALAWRGWQEKGFDRHRGSAAQASSLPWTKSIRLRQRGECRAVDLVVVDRKSEALFDGGNQGDHGHRVEFGNRTKQGGVQRKLACPSLEAQVPRQAPKPPRF
jgi:hypothetical protein